MIRQMKYSGIELIGDIPENWDVVKVKYHYTMQTGFTPDTKNDTYYDDENGYDWVTISDIQDGKIISDTEKKISQYYVDSENPTVIPEGSLLYSFKLSVGQTAYAGKNLYSNEAIASFLPNADVNLHYLRYSSIFIEGNSLLNVYDAKILNSFRIENALVPFPPLYEQEIIAQFLDKKCSEIESLAEKTRESIEEYKKLNQAVITEAVTKGVRGKREMKDSGVEWIGEIPKEWEVIPFKMGLESIVDYRGKTPEKVAEGVFLVTTRNIKSGRIDYNLSQEYIKLEDYDTVMNRGTVNIGDVLFTTEAPLGEVANADRNDFALAQRIVKFRGKKDYLNNYFLKYWMISTPFQDDTKSRATGSTALGIKASKFGQLRILLPPILEQQEIADYLDKKTAEIDNLIAKKEALLEELETYKKSLIYEYVTGKKQVVEE